MSTNDIVLFLTGSKKKKKVGKADSEYDTPGEPEVDARGMFLQTFFLWRFQSPLASEAMTWMWISMSQESRSLQHLSVRRLSLLWSGGKRKAICAFKVF